MKKVTNSSHWYSHCKEITKSFKNFISQNDSSDVTLVTDDQKSVQAHKIVLSASSPVLRNILLCNPHPHPLIYLRDIKHEDLQPVLEYMYVGEVTISEKHNIQAILEVTRQLQVRGIEPVLKKKPRCENGTNEGEFEFEIEPEIENITESFSDEEYKHKVKESNVELFKCGSCSKGFLNKSSLIKHEKKKHNLFHTLLCNQCEFITTDREILDNHRKSLHKSTKYSCNQCDHQASRPSDLSKHIKVKHLGFRYPCDKCEYKAS